jgi:hypothetical protein
MEPIACLGTIIERTTFQSPCQPLTALIFKLNDRSRYTRKTGLGTEGE